MVSENYELRARAREQLKGNWERPILACFLYAAITSAISAIPGVGVIGMYLTIGAFTVGLCLYSLNFIRGLNPKAEVIFDGFKNYGSTVGLYLWFMLWTLLWTFLFVIPGMVKAYAYSMSFYIMADNPNVGIKRALKISMAMTEGYKGKMFVLYLSFIGWALLCLLTLGIGFLCFIPYGTMSFANLYEELKREAIEKGVCTVSDFGEVEVSDEAIGIEM